MFKRLAIVTDIRPISQPAGVKTYSIPAAGTTAKAAASDVAKEVMAFEYDTENFVYFRCRAISADVPNGNGDFFPEPELIKAAKTFVGVGMYKDHDSDSVDKSIGKVLWAEWVPEGKYIECYCCIDRKLAPDMARRIETGHASTVSMGCMVGEAECGVKGCGNIAHNAMELCEHMTPGRGIKGKKGADGSAAYEINRMLQFTELSLVTVPADPTAKIFEVYAAHKAGKITDDELRKYIGEEVNNMLTAALKITTTENREPAVVATSSTSAAPVPTENSTPKVAPIAPATEAAVVKLVDSQEERMNLSINYQRGPSLASCFFIAKEAGVEFKVSAAEVLPLLVQEAITNSSGEGVATPDQIIAELTEKCASLSDFKAWAKKRAKKNKNAFEKMKEKQKGGDEKKDANPFAKKEEEAAADVAAAPAPIAPAPAAVAPGMPGSQDSLDAAPAAADAVVDEAVSSEPAQDASSVEELTLMIQDLQRQLEEKQLAHASADGTTKKAVKTEENVMDKRDNGASSGKTSPAKAPSAMNEISKTENPSGHIDKGAKASLAATAGEKGDKAIWSLNDKELEKPAKAGKAQQAAPPDGDISWDSKEMKSEQVKHDQGSKGSHGGSVKKFYNRLPSGGLGEAPKAMDLKSGVDESLAMKRALAEKDAKIAAMEEKERMAQVVDKIADIVSTLHEKGLITAEKEDETIKLLSSKFADVAVLDSVHKLVANLSAKADVSAQAESEDVPTGAAPQVFETVEASEDAVSLMSRIWNS